MNAPAPTSSPTSPPAPPVPARARVSDAEREHAVERLHRAVGEGRLDLAETDARSAAAYAAQYRDELTPILADLPDPGSTDRSSAAPAWTELWVALVWRARTLLLLGAERPTARQSRTAALLTLLAVLWTVAWAFAGAGAVG